MQSETDRQYLKAMNIDLWVLKDTEDSAAQAASPHVALQASPHASPSTAATLPEQATAQATAQAPTPTEPIRQWSLAQLQSSIQTLGIANTDVAQPQLLVVTEGVPLSADASALLVSMFKAIKLESTDWACVATDAEPSLSLKSVADNAKPKAVVVMAGTAGADTALDAMRGMQHRCSGVSPFVVVTYHPQELLDNPALKRPAWEDLKLLRQWLG